MGKLRLCGGGGDSGYVSTHGACGDGSRTTSQRYLIILEFMHFTSFFNFNTKGDDFKNKEQINGVKVRVGI
ncbi:hypothetical protein [Hathewaya limosa]|uniref:Uncharacterized protein n=1 Tax=Hathewaya limosa TaxID=1536 RepID=A0ABU0JSB1_HATLI|nr:hypothetical protein [Hathewaya limosa]MDQ0479063.1 hypothetical protein [Hathewaya limosa]